MRLLCVEERVDIDGVELYEERFALQRSHSGADDATISSRDEQITPASVAKDVEPLADDERVDRVAPPPGVDAPDLLMLAEQPIEVRVLAPAEHLDTCGR